MELSKLKRTELQKLSKDEGLKANLKTDALVEALEAHYAANPSRHPSAQGKTSRAASSMSVRAPSRTGAQTQQTQSQLRKPSQPFRPANATSSTTQGPKPAAATSTTENAAGSSTGAGSSAAPARAPRKAKETQLRLGVGRPKLVGGSGARATNPKPARVATGVRSVTTTRNAPSTAATRRKTPSGTQAASTKAPANANSSAADAPSQANDAQSHDETTAKPGQLPSISEDEPNTVAKPSASDESGDVQDMPIQLIPVLSNAQAAASAAAAATSMINSGPMQPAPIHASLPDTPSPLIVALEQTVDLLRTRVTMLEEQNVGLLQRVAALEATRSERERMTSFNVIGAGNPASPAMSIPQSARIRSDASSLVPQSARIRSDASTIMAISRPQSTVGGRRVSGMPSPRRTSLAVPGNWASGLVITEEDEASIEASLPHFDIPSHSAMTSTPMRPASVAPSPAPLPMTELAPTAAELSTPVVVPQPMPAVVPVKKMRAHVPVQKVVPPQPPVPLWRQGLFRDPYPPPNPTTLGKHARDSTGSAPELDMDSSNVSLGATAPDAMSTPADRPRKKPRLGKGLPSSRRSLAQQPQAEPATTPGGFPLLSATMAEFAERRAAGLPGPPPRTSGIQQGVFPFIDEPSPADSSKSFAQFANRTSMGSSAVPEDSLSTSTGTNEMDGGAQGVSESLSGVPGPAPKTPPRNASNVPPPPETPLTAAYGPVLAALFRAPSREDLPEEERSPEKKTVYGTECRGNTRFGEYGWDWRY